MIYHKTKCLFIHIPKTAGKSVSSLFGLPLQAKDYKNPFSWIADPFGHASVTRYQSTPWFKDYFKFSFVRNPFDRLVSAFFYLNRGGINNSDQHFAENHLREYQGNFRRFVLEGLESAIGHTHFRPQASWICNDGGLKPLVDFLGRYENLENDIRRVSTHLRIPLSTIPHLNYSLRNEWPSYYDNESKTKVLDLYSQDFELLGYNSLLRSSDIEHARGSFRMPK